MYLKIFLFLKLKIFSQIKNTFFVADDLNLGFEKRQAKMY